MELRCKIRHRPQLSNTKFWQFYSVRIHSIWNLAKTCLQLHVCAHCLSSIFVALYCNIIILGIKTFSCCALLWVSKVMVVTTIIISTKYPLLLFLSLVGDHHPLINHCIFNASQANILQTTLTDRLVGLTTWFDWLTSRVANKIGRRGHWAPTELWLHACQSLYSLSNADYTSIHHSFRLLYRTSSIEFQFARMFPI